MTVTKIIPLRCHMDFKSSAVVLVYLNHHQLTSPLLPPRPLHTITVQVRGARAFLARTSKCWITNSLSQRLAKLAISGTHKKVASQFVKQCYHASRGVLAENVQFTTLLSETPSPWPFASTPVHNFNLVVRKISDGDSTTYRQFSSQLYCSQTSLIVFRLGQPYFSVSVTHNFPPPVIHVFS
jgi:hypothetical protein